MLTNLPDELDRTILALLEEDGRRPSLDIARRLGVSEKTIRLRIARLMRQHGMRVTATLTGVVTRQTRMLFLIHTGPGRRFDVARRLAALAEVQYVFATTGAFDLVVEGAFPTDADALEFLVRDVEGADGVASCQSVHLIKAVEADSIPGTQRVPATPVDVDFVRFVDRAAHAKSADELLNLAADAALVICGADRVLVSLLEIQDAPLARGIVEGCGVPLVRMTSSVGRGLRPEYVDEVVRRVNDGKTRGVTYRVVESGLHVIVEDCLTDPLFDGLWDVVRKEGYTSLIAVPMFGGERVIGSINLYYDQPRHPSDEEIGVAQAFADQVSLALVQARE